MSLTSNLKLKKRLLNILYLTITLWRKRMADRRGGYNLDKDFTQKIFRNFYQWSIDLDQGYGTYMYLTSFLKVCATFGLAEWKTIVEENIFLEICFGLDFKPRNIPYIKPAFFVNLKKLKRIGLSRKTSYSKTEFQIYCFEVHTCVHLHILQSLFMWTVNQIWEKGENNYIDRTRFILHRGKL